MTHALRLSLLTASLFLALPTVGQAGPPLICHPFQTAGGELLPWGTGPGWNTPDRNYDVRRLTADVLRLLAEDAPILTRMENIRRAVIYASRDAQAADQLLAAVVARVTDKPKPLALFDAGYLIESFKQAAHLHGGRHVTTADGYAMVTKALLVGGSNPEMEFAAALMTSGAKSESHLRRARAAAAAESLLAKNITNLGW